MNHSLVNYIRLTLPSVYSDPQMEIYEMVRGADFEDKSKDFVSLRDRRRDR